MIYVIDCTQASSDYDFPVVKNSSQYEDFVKDEVKTFSDMYDATYSLLVDFYEARSDYGNPIYDLLRYIPEDKYEEILEDLYYVCGNSLDEVLNKYNHRDW